MEELVLALEAGLGHRQHLEREKALERLSRALEDTGMTTEAAPYLRDS
jgi:hypothetical protein